MAKETAEQKLLKMMQKKSEPVAIKNQPVAKTLKFSFSISLLNKLLLLGIVACVVVLVMEMRFGFSLLERTVDFSDEGKGSNALADIALPSEKPVDYYLENINTRNIFKPYDAQAVAKPVVEDFSLAKRLSKFKLVGIAWLDLPETACVMIEDPQAQQMYFLKQGELLEGVTVKTIYTDRAVFSYENEETTIKL